MFVCEVTTPIFYYKGSGHVLFSFVETSRRGSSSSDQQRRCLARTLKTLSCSSVRRTSREAIDGGWADAMPAAATNQKEEQQLLPQKDRVRRPTRRTRTCSTITTTSQTTVCPASGLASPPATATESCREAENKKSLLTRRERLCWARRSGRRCLAPL